MYQYQLLAKSTLFYYVVSLHTHGVEINRSLVFVCLNHCSSQLLSDGEIPRAKTADDFNNQGTNKSSCCFVW